MICALICLITATIQGIYIQYAHIVAYLQRCLDRAAAISRRDAV